MEGESHRLKLILQSRKAAFAGAVLPRLYAGAIGNILFSWASFSSAAGWYFAVSAPAICRPAGSGALYRLPALLWRPCGINPACPQAGFCVI